MHTVHKNGVTNRVCEREMGTHNHADTMENQPTILFERWGEGINKMVSEHNILWYVFDMGAECDRRGKQCTMKKKRKPPHTAHTHMQI